MVAMVTGSSSSTRWPNSTSYIVTTKPLHILPTIRFFTKHQKCGNGLFFLFENEWNPKKFSLCLSLPRIKLLTSSQNHLGLNLSVFFSATWAFGTFMLQLERGVKETISTISSRYYFPYLFLIVFHIPSIYSGILF